MKRTLMLLVKILFAFSCIGVGLYPIMYFLVDRKFGLLGSKSSELLANIPWNIGFYCHIIFGGIALLIGWIQFIKKLRVKNPGVHRTIGKVYVLAVLLSGSAGIGIGFKATGGVVSMSGFIGLGIIWLFFTLRAYFDAKSGDFEHHRQMMIYSYSACFAAVTLRIWLPILINFYGDFIPAYRTVAWLCWVPNIAGAYFIVNFGSRKKSII